MTCSSSRAANGQGRAETGEALGAVKKEQSNGARSRPGAPASLRQRAGAAPAEKPASADALAIALERLDLAQEAAGAGVWDWDIAAGKLTWTPHMFRLFGLDPARDTASFEAWRSVVHPEDVSAAEERISAAVRDRIRLMNDYRIVMPSGEVRWIHAVGSAVYDAAGRPLRMTGICIDATDFRLVRQESERITRELQATFNASNDGILILDCDDRVLRANTIAERLFDRPAGDMRGKRCWTILHGSPTPHPDDPLVRARQSGRRVSMEVQHGARWLEISIDPITDAAGRYNGAVHTARDITERKRVEQVHLFLAQCGVSASGEPFFNALARYLAQSLDMDFVCIDRLEGDSLSARTLAVWCDGRFEDNVTYDLKDTPCGDVVGKAVCCFPASVCQFFPRDQVLRDLRAESYVGATLWSHSGQPIGLIALISRKQLSNRAQAEGLLNLVAARAASEMERLQVESELRVSEERYRTLFSESPIALWEEDFSAVKSRFDELRRSGVVDVRSYLDGHPDEVVAMAARVRILAINQRSWELLGAGSAAEVARDLPDYFTPDSLRVFKEEMVALAEGKRMFRAEIPVLNKRKDLLLLDLRLVVPPEHAHDLSHVLVSFLDITESKRAEQMLREKEMRFRSYFELPLIGVCITSLTKGWLEVNDRLCTMLGYDRAELLGSSWKDLTHPDDLDADLALFNSVLQGSIDQYGLEKRFIRKDGELVFVELSVGCVRKPDGTVDFFVALLQDITARKRAEEAQAVMQAQLMQARKMETVGLLAGGVAHNFNNLLMGILNYVELCRDGLPPEHPVVAFLDAITSDAERSTDLTRRLLAFARKQTIAPKVLDLNDTVAAALKLMRSVVGEGIAIAWAPGAKLWPVRLDPFQVDQILASLCSNARDAISGHGGVFVETANVTIRQSGRSSHMDAPAGDYVLLAVKDDGSGMDRKALDTLFEPFFTTKDLSAGAGLGLAAVHGIVEQNKGFIHVDSEPGKGTTFKIHFPRAAAEALQAAGSAPPARRPGGRKTVLLVEDDKSVLISTGMFLEKLGYFVLAAGSAAEALRLAAAHEGAIDLLVTDVIMPDMNGRQLAEQVLASRPAVKCLFMSGYAADALIGNGDLTKDKHFLLKPFSRDVFARTVRVILEET